MLRPGKLSFTTLGQFQEQYELDLRADGTFRMSVGYSDPAGWAGGWSASGR